MKERKMYTIDKKEIERRVSRMDLTDILNEKLV